MKDESGVALILALLVLSFLTILGGALLTTSTIDIMDQRQLQNIDGTFSWQGSR